MLIIQFVIKVLKHKAFSPVVSDIWTTVSLGLCLYSAVALWLVRNKFDDSSFLRAYGFTLVVFYVFFAVNEEHCNIHTEMICCVGRIICKWHAIYTMLQKPPFLVTFFPLQEMSCLISYLYLNSPLKLLMLI